MSGLVMMQFENAIEIYADGCGFTLPDHVLRVVRSKIYAIPEFSFLMAGRGCGPSLPLLYLALQDANSFDNIVEHMAAAVKGVHEKIIELVGEEVHWTVYFGGWSESRERFETYAVPTQDKNQELEEEFFKGKAFTLEPMKRECVIAPVVLGDVVDELGGDLGELLYGGTPEGRALVVHAQRLSSARMDGGVASMGGFIESALAMRGLIQKRILYRYDDKVGEQMRPKPGETEAIIAACRALANPPPVEEPKPDPEPA